MSLHAESILSQCRDALCIKTAEPKGAHQPGTQLFRKVEKLYKLRNPKTSGKVLSPDLLEDIKIALEERRRLKEGGELLI